MNFNVEQAYIYWICNILEINYNGNIDECYSKLITALNHFEFYSPIAMDENRAVDGLQYRYDFLKTYPELAENFDGPCTFLEFLVGLSHRLAVETEVVSSRVSLGRWFFEMIKNLGLEGYNDAVFDSAGGLFAVQKVHQKVIERQYKPDGNGGLFPLKRPPFDCRTVEFWQQMNAYLNEKYSFLSTI